jgi:hypothetical protein
MSIPADDLQVQIDALEARLVVLEQRLYTLDAANAAMKALIETHQAAIAQAAR